MRFVYNSSLNPAAGAIATKTFRANGPYDPDYAVGGGQPYGYDQLAVFFERYTVIGARVKLTVFSESSTASATNANVIFILPSLDATAPTSILDVQGQPQAKMAPLGSVYSNKAISTVTATFNAARTFRTADPVTNGQIGGLYNGTPDLEAFFHIGYGSITASDPDTVYYSIMIEYDTVWYGRRQITSS
jgi:hypothetical protein